MPWYRTTVPPLAPLPDMRVIDRAIILQIDSTVNANTKQQVFAKTTAQYQVIRQKTFSAWQSVHRNMYTG